MIYVIDIVGGGTIERGFRLLSVKKDAMGYLKYDTAVVPEYVLKHKMLQGLRVENARLEGGHIVGSTGSLDRFTHKEGIKPLVILYEMVNESGDMLGYRVSDSNGKVSAVKLEDLLQYCAKVRYSEYIPIQNGMYVAEGISCKPHIRSFKSSGYPKEVLKTSKIKQTYQVGINRVENRNNIKRINEIFNTEQINELKMGKEKGLDITIYANKNLSAEQMRVIREGLESKINAKLYSDPRFSVMQMKRLKAEMEMGINVIPYANPAYSNAQMTQIKLGLLSGVDITKYANPKTPSEEMAEIRMRLEAGIWCDCEASQIDADELLK